MTLKTSWPTFPETDVKFTCPHQRSLRAQESGLKLPEISTVLKFDIPKQKNAMQRWLAPLNDFPRG